MQMSDDMHLLPLEGYKNTEINRSKIEILKNLYLFFHLFKKKSNIFIYCEH